MGASRPTVKSEGCWIFSRIDTEDPVRAFPGLRRLSPVAIRRRQNPVSLSTAVWDIIQRYHNCPRFVSLLDSRHVEVNQELGWKFEFIDSRIIWRPLIGRGTPSPSASPSPVVHGDQYGIMYAVLDRWCGRHLLITRFGEKRINRCWKFGKDVTVGRPKAFFVKICWSRFRRYPMWSTVGCGSVTMEDYRPITSHFKESSSILIIASANWLASVHFDNQSLAQKTVEAGHCCSSLATMYPKRWYGYD